MGRKITLASYAKLNLTLRVTGIRSDGFHDLETLFERIDLCDYLTFVDGAGSDIHIECDNRCVPRDSRNLVYQAAKLFQDRYGIRKGVRITIKKNIPVAAGLAGGSSNAATTLQGLNKLWRVGLSASDLLPLARKIGSDVAFFLFDIPWALGTGRGDKIKPVKLTTRLHHLLITPKRPVLTKDVYKMYDRLHLEAKQVKPGGGDFSLTKSNDAVTILICSLRKNDIIGAGAHIFNDLESSILTLQPSLQKLKVRVQRSQVLGASFSGSGPSIFALTATQDAAEHLRVRFARTYQQVFVVKTRD